MRKRWESNPHESLTPNCFQDSDHRPLVCPSFKIAENKGIEPSPQRIEDSLSRRAQQTNICLFSFLLIQNSNLTFQILKNNLERTIGFEPIYPDWKSGILPLNYARILYPRRESLSVRQAGNPQHRVSKTRASADWATEVFGGKGRT